MDEQEFAEIAQIASLADETPEGRSIVVLAKQKYGLRERGLLEAPAYPSVSHLTMGPNLLASRARYPERTSTTPSGWFERWAISR